MVIMPVMPDPALQPLDYAPVETQVRQWWKVRRLLIWLVIAAALFATLQYGPAMVQQAWYIGSQRKCMAYTAPADQLDYANDPAEATGLLATGWKSVASVVGQSPYAVLGPTMSAGRELPPLSGVGEETLGSYARIGWGYIRQGVNNAPIRTGAFLHARQAKGSPERLVAIVFLERQNAPTEDRLLEINALVWRPATWSPGSRLELAGLSTRVFTKIDRRRVHLFAGQPDPADASHFTLRYDIDGQPGTIDGWLDSFDRVRLQVRDGPALAEMGP